MKIKNLIFAILTLSSCTGMAQEKPKDAYQLVWADEFNQDGAPNSNNWNYEKGFVRNEELQWYQPDNARCENGLLIIEAKKVNLPNPNYKAGSKSWRENRPNIEYTSSCLITQGKQQWQYGRFEIRAKIDIRSGLWPAWWTLGIQKPWPANGEIDIMEFYRGKILANIACLGTSNKTEWHSKTQSVDGAWASQFHTWRMDWDEEHIALYVDDQLMISTPLSQLENKDGSGFNPFKQPHYMLFDLAIGGQNGGDPSNTTFPNRFEVDYVRVYQKQ